MKIADLFAASNPFMALVLAVVVSAGLFGVLVLGSGGARAQIQPSMTSTLTTTSTPTATPTETPSPTATPYVAGPVIVVETAIPEDWHVDRASEVISVFEAFTSDGGGVTFTLRETSDSANFVLVPAGTSAEGNHRAHLLLKQGVTLDHDTQDTFAVDVLASAESGVSTQVLLRLRITETDPGSRTPTPTPTATPSPLGDCGRAIEGKVSQEGDWLEDDDCLSKNRPLSSRPGPGDYYARYFTFTLDEPATVSISLTSEVDTYLYLMRGVGSDGEIVAENDDALPRVDLNSSILERLSAGAYTIEATTYEAEEVGRFRLVVSGLPGAGDESDCLTGGAVQDPAANAQLVADCEILLEMRPTFDRRGLLNWATDVPMDEWHGVTTGGSPLRVTELALANNGLHGVIPTQLDALSGLETLSLSDNGLYGTIPSELGTLDNLTVLALDSNRLRGTIPAELGYLTALETLTLDHNDLEGSIPFSLRRLGRLQVLRLGNNELTGAIHTELGGLSNLRVLDLGDNELTGTIPTEFSALHRLEVLDLANNKLSGAIPTELGRLSHLKEVRIAGNSFSGCVPSNFGDAADNDIAQIGLPFCPSGICFDKPAVPNPFENAELVGDCNALLNARLRLEGALDADTERLNWSLATPMEQWEGITISGSPRRVISLALLSRGLTGRLPSQLGELDELSSLHLYDNNLSGSIPSSFGSLTQLQILILDNNSVSGAIPSAIGDMSSLHYVSLKGNMISGDIPPELSMLEELTVVDLKDNKLTGAIPGELGSLPKLRFLHLDGNMLSGSIPPELGDSMVLERLSIDDNKLTGEIPQEFGAMSSLQVLELAYNDLTGEIPDELGNIPNLRQLTLYGNEFVGCVPKALKDITSYDVRALGLEICGEGECADSTAVKIANGAARDRLVSDCNTLLSLQDMLEGDDSGARALNWSASLAINKWQGITIGTTQARVEGLNLSRKDNTTNTTSIKPLKGVIPPEIKHLAKLVNLKLSNNDLGSANVDDDDMPYGGIPDEIGTLTGLKTLLLDRNNLHGKIPVQISNLANLQALLLAKNELTGKIPSELTMLERLANISLSGNKLIGCVPAEWKNIAQNDFDKAQSDSYGTVLPFCSDSDDSEE